MTYAFQNSTHIKLYTHLLSWSLNAVVFVNKTAGKHLFIDSNLIHIYINDNTVQVMYKRTKHNCFIILVLNISCLKKKRTVMKCAGQM